MLRIASREPRAFHELATDRRISLNLILRAGSGRSAFISRLVAARLDATTSRDPLSFPVRRQTAPLTGACIFIRPRGAARLRATFQFLFVTMQFTPGAILVFVSLFPPLFLIFFFFYFFYFRLVPSLRGANASCPGDTHRQLIRPGGSFPPLPSPPPSRSLSVFFSLFFSLVRVVAANRGNPI